MNRRTVFLAVGVAGFTAGVVAFERLRPPVTPSAGSPAAIPAPAAAAPASPPAGDAAPGLPPLPGSLRDTEVDGELTLDASGRFVPNPQALALFDYFLAAGGEEPPEVIRARIVARIHDTLPPDAAVQAMAFLDTYLAYRERMRALTLSGSPPDDLERRLQWIREERRRAFGAELAETLFGEEEAVASLDLERRRVLQDTTLTPEARAQRLEEIASRLPERVRAARESAAAPARVAKEVEALRAGGASESQVWEVRARAFGPDAAARLEALDRDEKAWQARLDAWREERARIAADPSLSPEERSARIDALRATRFDAQEELRVRALEGSEAGAP